MTKIKIETGYLNLATALLMELITRPFTASQYKVLLFFIRLSYGIRQKDTIYLDKKSSLKILGIHHSNANKILQQLVDYKVIIPIDINAYKINSDADAWLIKPNIHDSWHETFDCLVHLNLFKLKRANQIKASASQNKNTYKTAEPVICDDKQEYIGEDGAGGKPESLELAEQMQLERKEKRVVPIEELLEQDENEYYERIDW